LGSQAVVSVGTNDGVVMKSTRHSLQLSSGQPPGGNDVLRSKNFRVQGGVLGASASPAAATPSPAGK
jgi:hypothetical protein